MKHTNLFANSYVMATLLLVSFSVVEAQTIDTSNKPTLNHLAQKDEFIAAFEWSVEKRSEYVWPFESIRSAPYESVRMLVAQMPLAFPDDGSTKSPVSLSAYQCLRVNGKRLPKPRRSAGTEFRVYLDEGRLHLSFALPPGFRLDPKNSFVRIRLFQV